MIDETEDGNYVEGEDNMRSPWIYSLIDGEVMLTFANSNLAWGTQFFFCRFRLWVACDCAQMTTGNTRDAIMTACLSLALVPGKVGYGSILCVEHVNLKIPWICFDVFTIMYFRLRGSTIQCADSQRYEYWTTEHCARLVPGFSVFKPPPNLSSPPPEI